MRFFVTGIGTEVGKTLASAVFVEALGADYWKPVQAGDLELTDSDRIRQWAPSHGTIHLESYRLRLAASPHHAAAVEGIEIDLGRCELPQANRPLIVEGAGGVMVPLNDKDLMIDLMARLDLPGIVVSRHYLGSINHTLLTLETLHRRGLRIHGVIFSGPPTLPTEEAIMSQSQVRCLGGHS